MRRSASGKWNVSRRSIDTVFLNSRACHEKLGKLKKLTVREESEGKKGELRTLVGERYRDLIDAADSILQMKPRSELVRDTMNKLCRMMNTIEPEKKELGSPESNKFVYPIAAQIKLLVDTPEQIWFWLEKNRYLNASLLYLIAKEIHKNLDHPMLDSYPSHLEQFPIAQRQWDAIGPFKSQIVSRTKTFLATPNISVQNATEALVAALLLESFKLEEALELFLHVRKDQITRVISDFNTSTMSVSEAMCLLVSLVKSTLLQTVEIFTTEGIRVLVRSMEQGVMLLPSGDRMPERLLYNSSKTKIHTLIRYLPHNVQHLKPRVNYISEVGTDVVSKQLASWFIEVKSILDEKCQLLLTVADSGEAIYGVREAMAALLIADEKDLRLKRKSTWLDVSALVFKEPSSLWDKLFRDIFWRTSEFFVKETVDALFQRLCSEADTLLQVSHGQNIDLESAIWEEEDTFLSGEGGALLSPTKANVDMDRYKQIPPDVAGIIASIDDALSAAHRSILPLVSVAEFRSGHIRRRSSISEDLAWNLPEELGGVDVFQRHKIALLLRDKYQQEFKHMMVSFMGHLEKLLSSASDDVTFRKSCSIGRLAKSLCYHSEFIPKILALSDDASFIELNALSDKICAKSFEPWIKYLGELFSKELHAYLDDKSAWDNISYIILRGSFTSSDRKQNGMASSSWDLVKVELKNDKHEAVQDQIIAPSHPSERLLRALLTITDEVQKQGGYTLSDDGVLLPLTQTLALGMMDTFNTWQKQASESSFKDQRCFYQIYFDMNFLWRCLKANPEERVIRRFAEVRDAVKRRLDPIELSLIEVELQERIERSHARYHSLLNFFAQFSPPAEKKSASFLQEQHNVVPILPVVNRFNMAPVSFQRPKVPKLPQLALLEQPTLHATTFETKKATLSATPSFVSSIRQFASSFK